MSQSPIEEPRYPIRAVSRMTGIPAATLRSWERRYGFPAPARSTTARRLYSQIDIDAIRWLKAQLALGLSIAHAVQWYRSGRGADSTPPLTREEGATALLPGAAPDTTASYERFLQEMLRAAAEYDEVRMEAALSAAFAVHSPDRVLMELIVPAQHAIGDRWHDGMLPVTAEHFASNVFRRRICALLAQMPVASLGPLAVLACVPGEEHDLALLMLALFLRWRGLRTLYLGANVPTGYLLDCLRETHASALCLSAVTTDSAPVLADTVAAVALATTGISIFTGGAGSHGVQRAAGAVNLAGELRGAAATIATTLGLPAAPANADVRRG